MTKFTRSIFSSISAWFSGKIGFFIVAIFGPLLFPASITGSSVGENIVVFSGPVFFLAFGVGGFLTCWKYTQRFADKEEQGKSARTFTDFPDN